MKHKVFIGCIFFCFLACTRQYESTAPKDLISQKEIEEVLVDVYVLEAAVRTCTLSNQTDSLNLWTSQQMNAILKKGNITYQQFLNSYYYYMGHEESAQKIMENVVNQLIKEETTAMLRIQKLNKDTAVDLKAIGNDVVTVKIKK